jgi:hypothetical protein
MEKKENREILREQSSKIKKLPKLVHEKSSIARR